MSEPKLTRGDIERIADERVARALRALGDKVDPTRGGLFVEHCEAVAARLTAAEPAPKVPSCRSCGDQWGLCDCGPAPEEQPALDPLPPLNFPEQIGFGVWEWKPIGEVHACNYSADWAANRAITIARAERAAREAERAELAVLRERAEKAEAKAAVCGGEWCAKNRAEGRGPCGACAWCCAQERERAEKAEAERDEAREAYLAREQSIRAALLALGVVMP